MTSLVKKIDAKIDADKKLKSFVVITTDKDGGDKASEALKAMAKEASIRHVPLVLYQEPGGPPDYELSRDADFTILMWNFGKVKVNRAFKGDLTEKQLEGVMSDIAKFEEK